ncbi:ATP-binding protein [Clostridium sp. KNHs214]|uniref:ATP-binding protein n=1 Tax=Clostridium sp. KNHs214 TaxID=1540257 RepID=UPI00068F7C17|nr:ATP-binding protein [Clostridium sp. KNHs214]
MEQIKKAKNKDMFKKMIFVVLIVSLSSQIYLDLIIANFRISFAIILFGVFMYSFEELNSIITGAYTSIGVYILRVVMHTTRGGRVVDGMQFYFPEIFFYFSYAVFFYFILKKVSRRNINKMFFYIVFSDFFANFIELLIRDINNIRPFYNYDVKWTLLIVAVVRTVILWLCLNFIKYYKMLLLKEEHENRYRKLLLMTARLKTETYWMKKTMDNLEKVMAQAYDLFEKITLDQEKEFWASRAVDIAKNVHEIKKEYGIVVRGVEEVTSSPDEGKGMYFKDLINILEISMKNEIKYKDKDIDVKFKIRNNFYTEKHYFLMSIFRNILMNAIEALEGKEKGYILFGQSKEENNYIFVIEDNGAGIKKKDINYIFSPGYSTKINYGTGVINRGLGLSIVKHIIEGELKGEVTITSKENEGTAFHISIPKKVLEEEEKWE